VRVLYGEGLAFNSSEVAETAAWASEGCVGPVPSPDMARLEELARAVAEANALRAFVFA
jgi:hypothetical protein